MDTKQLVEELNSLIEDELVDDFEDVEVSDNHLSEEPEKEPEKEPEPRNITDELDAKTKISRALDVLISAVDDFKNAISTEIDLVADADFHNLTEELDNVILSMQNAITGEHLKGANPQEELEEVPEDEKLEEEPEEEISFEDEASLDLFNPEEE